MPAASHTNRALAPVGETRLCHLPVDTDLPIADAVGQAPTEWLVAYTKPRAEKVCFEACKRSGIAALLPLERRIRRYPGKGTQVSMVPLLTSYLFIGADGGGGGRDAIYQTGSVMTLLDPHDQDAFRHELANLTGLLQTPGEQLLVQPAIVAGTTVRLQVGSLAGYEGIVQRRKGTALITVNLSLLGSSVAVEVDATTVDIVERAA